MNRDQIAEVIAKLRRHYVGAANELEDDLGEAIGLLLAIQSDGWQTIDSAPMKRLIIGTDGSVVQPIRRLEPDVIYCPQPTSIDLWTHWRPFPSPPGDAG